VLAVACLGVLKYNGLYGKGDRAGEKPATASFLPIGGSATEPDSTPAEGIARLRPLNRWMGANPGIGTDKVGPRSEGSNHINSATMDHVRNRR
jgi:hypothetical protein